VKSVRLGQLDLTGASFTGLTGLTGVQRFDERVRRPPLHRKRSTRSKANEGAGLTGVGRWPKGVSMNGPEGGPTPFCIAKQCNPKALRRCIALLRLGCIATHPPYGLHRFAWGMGGKAPQPPPYGHQRNRDPPVSLYLSIIWVAGRVIRKEAKKEEGNKEGYNSVNEDL
jgi:hypothetical protein